MKKFWIILALFLVGCTKELPFAERVDNLIEEKGITVIEKNTYEEELITFTNDTEVGLMTIDEDFEVITETLPKEGKEVELLHIGNDYYTYFGVIVRDEELFTKADKIVIGLITSDEPLVFDVTGDYQMIMVQFLNQSLTSCGADSIEVFNGEESLYSESLIPT